MLVSVQFTLCTWSWHKTVWSWYKCGPCEQEACHLVSFIGFQGAPLIDNEDMHGAYLPGQPKMSLLEGDACLTNRCKRSWRDSTQRLLGPRCVF